MSPSCSSADATTADLHLARSNPIARADLPAPALIAVSGPDAYVSPDWYGAATDQVPTWNYVAVHLRGTLAALPVETLRAHVDALSARLREPTCCPRHHGLPTKMTEGVMHRMMRMILPFRLTIDRHRRHLEAEPEQDARDAPRGGRRALGPGRRGPGADTRSPYARGRVSMDSPHARA